MPNFSIDQTIFLCETEKVNENEWKAEISYIQKNSGKTSQARQYVTYGPSEQIAIENLKNEITELFFIKNEKVNWYDIFISLYKWIKAGGKKTTIASRIFLLLLLLLLFSFLFFDYQKGPLLNLQKNYNFLFDKKNQSQFADTGFLTEQFIATALKNTDSVFWASNVSFRNLQVGNKSNLESFLDRKKQFKLVLLDTGSVLAQNDFLSSFSRTATKNDINNTITSLLNENNGSLRIHGDQSIHQLYLSKYSPIVPMLRIDDTIYVSFPIHTDIRKTKNNYGGPFLKFAITSKFGSMLKDHFLNMLNSPDTQIIYP